MTLSSLTHRLFRLKRLRREESTQLDKCLSTFDLTALGVGATLGVGIYVLSGSVAKDIAGPSVVISFLIAGIASAMSGLCYAELGARVPKAGSAYIYSYVTVGEVVAFVIGWNLVLEYAIGTASVARGYSGYLDHLLNKTMENSFRNAMPIDIPYLSAYPDFCAFFIAQVLSVILCIGVKESTRFNNIFTCLNIAVVIFVVTAGFIKADGKNWQIPEENLPKDETHDYGVGGFFPYGFSGSLAGAATCFYGYVGFDSVATSGEETTNPQFSIPFAICVSQFIVFVAYCGISSAITLMIPYYLQDPDAPLPAAFNMVGWPAIGWIVSVGALFGLSTSLLGAMFPLPRILYSMASDGLIFRWFAVVHPKFQTPLRATVISGLFCGGMAMLFDIQSLVDMMSIGTLMAYTIVAVCVIILRYQNFSASSDTSPSRDYMSLGSLLSPSQKLKKTNDDEDYFSDDDDEEIVYCAEESLDLIHRKRAEDLENEPIEGFGEFVRLCFNTARTKSPTGKSSRLATWLTLCVLCLNTILVVILLNGNLVKDRGFVTGFVIVFVLLILVLFCLWLQPTSKQKLSFSVPFVPFLPTLSVFCNIYLMAKLSSATWVRFAVWLAFGSLIYGLYGWRNASEEYRLQGKVPPNERRS